MSKWIAEFDLEDGDTMPEHMDLEYKGVKIDFHCRPEEPVIDKIRAEIEQLPTNTRINWDGCCPDIDYPEIEYVDVTKAELLQIIDKYKAESEENMSVLIKTMTNLPEHCYDCPCHDGESGYCQADKEHRYSEYRPFWCPLVKISNTESEE